MDSSCNQLVDMTDDSGFVSQSSYGNSSEQTSGYNKTPQLSSTSYWWDLRSLNNDSLNESLPHNFAKFALNSTPNYYVERDESTTNSISMQHQMTPSKSQPGYSSNVKLGSPERNEILYQKLRASTNSKTKTPQKIFKKHKPFSPAKKRLFEYEKVDPVTFFINNRHNHSVILRKILCYLSESDLCSFRRVSSKWRDALSADTLNYSRYSNFINKLQINKENNDSMLNDSNEKSYEEKLCAEESFPATSPRKRKFNECLELGKTLTYGQTISKCQKCQSPSIVDRNISQCPRPMCGYIYCSICGSFSTSGPENFIDKCKSAILITEKVKVPRRLTDSPPKEIDPNQLPFFLRDTTNLNYCDTKLDQGINNSVQQPVILKKRLSTPTNLFKTTNRNMFNHAVSVKSKPLIATVVLCNEEKQDMIIEPYSPPKVSNVACSKQSKKRIKRRLVI